MKIEILVAKEKERKSRSPEKVNNLKDVDLNGVPMCIMHGGQSRGEEAYEHTSIRAQIRRQPTAM